MFLDSYLPRIQHAAGECKTGYLALMHKLEQIRQTIEQGNQVPNLHDKVLRWNGTVPASGTLDVYKVPVSQAWTIEFVSASAAWSIRLNGSLMLASTNGNIFGGAPILLPGEVATVIATPGTEVTIQITRQFLDGDPQRAHSGSGNENWINGAGSRHEGNRDVIDVGPYPHRRSALVLEN